MPTFGKKATTASIVGTVTNFGRATVYGAIPEAAWLYRWGVLGGRTSGTATYVRGHVLAVSSGVPAALLGNTSELAVTNPGSYGGDLTQITGNLTSIVGVAAGTNISLGFASRGGEFIHGLASAPAGANPAIYQRSSVGSTGPYNPWSHTSIPANSWVVMWVEYVTNVKPNVPINRSPHDLLSSAPSEFTGAFRDTNETVNGVDNKPNEKLTQYRIQLRETGAGSLKWDDTYTADSGEQTARAFSTAYDGSGSLDPGIAYEWRCAVSDTRGAWSDWSSWLAFQVGSAGTAGIQFNPGVSGRITTLQPTGFAVSYTHPTGKDTDSQEIQILSGDTVIREQAITATHISGSSFTLAPTWGGVGDEADLAWGQSLTWRWRAIDEDAAPTAWSTAVAFNTNYRPSTPANLAPAGGVVSYGYPLLTFTLSDQDNTVATGLEAQVRIKDDASVLLVTRDAVLISGTTWGYQTGPGDFSTSDTYRWDARGTDPDLDGTWSTEADFYYADAPDVLEPDPEDVVPSSSLAIAYDVSGQVARRFTIYREGETETNLVTDWETTASMVATLDLSAIATNGGRYELVVEVELTGAILSYSVRVPFTVILDPTHTVEAGAGAGPVAVANEPDTSAIRMVIGDHDGIDSGNFLAWRVKEGDADWLQRWNELNGEVPQPLAILPFASSLAGESRGGPITAVVSGPKRWAPAPGARVNWASNTRAYADTSHIAAEGTGVTIGRVTGLTHPELPDGVTTAASATINGAITSQGLAFSCRPIPTFDPSLKPTHIRFSVYLWADSALTLDVVGFRATYNDGTNTTSTGAVVATLTTTPQLVTTDAVAVSATKDLALVQAICRTGSAHAANVFYATACMVEFEDAVGEWFDADTIDGAMWLNLTTGAPSTAVASGDRINLVRNPRALTDADDVGEEGTGVTIARETSLVHAELPATVTTGITATIDGTNSVQGLAFGTWDLPTFPALEKPTHARMAVYLWADSALTVDVVGLRGTYTDATVTATGTVSASLTTTPQKITTSAVALNSSKDVASILGIVRTNSAHAANVIHATAALIEFDNELGTWIESTEPTDAEWDALTPDYEVPVAHASASVESVVPIIEPDAANLVTNPWFAVNTTGWSATNAAIARSTTRPYLATGIGTLTATTTNATATTSITAPATTHTALWIIENRATSSRTYQLTYNGSNIGSSLSIFGGGCQPILATFTGTGGAASLSIVCTNSANTNITGIAFAGAIPGDWTPVVETVDAPEAERTVNLVGDPHHGWTPEARLDDAIPDLTATITDCDYRVYIGDMGETIGDSSDQAAAVAWMDAIGGERGYLAGNHDIGPSYTTAQYHAAMGGDYTTTNWVEDRTHYRLIALNPDGGAGWDTDAPVTLTQDTLDWLDARLGETDLPCVIVCHGPLKDTSTGGYSTAAGIPFWHANPDTEIRAVLAAHDNAKVWAGGHTHSPREGGNVVRVTVGDHDLIAINTSATAYVGQKPASPSDSLDDPLYSPFVSIYSDRLEVRWRDHLTGEWLAQVTEPWVAQEQSVAVPLAGPYTPAITWANTIESGDSWDGTAHASASTREGTIIDVPMPNEARSLLCWYSEDGTSWQIGYSDFPATIGDHGVVTWADGTLTITSTAAIRIRDLITFATPLNVDQMAFVATAMLEASPLTWDVLGLVPWADYLIAAMPLAAELTTATESTSFDTTELTYFEPPLTVPRTYALTAVIQDGINQIESLPVNPFAVACKVDVVILSDVADPVGRRAWLAWRSSANLDYVDNRVIVDTWGSDSLPSVIESTLDYRVVSETHTLHRNNSPLSPRETLAMLNALRGSREDGTPILVCYRNGSGDKIIGRITKLSAPRSQQGYLTATFELREVRRG